MDLAVRNNLIASFRRQVQSAISLDGHPLIPLRSQADWQLASEGWTLLDTSPSQPGDYYCDVLIPKVLSKQYSLVLSERTVNGIACKVIRRQIVPRPTGPAHIIAALEAFKAGKSFWTGFWATGFAPLPDAKVHFVALQYANAEPEFNYLADFLLSDAPRGLNMPYVSFHNDTRGGRMRLKLRTGAEFQVMSWDNKEALKGKKVTAYVFCEAHQLPDLSVYNSLSQNLREQQGFALFPTTPDRPWIGFFHDYGHGHDPDFHCTCCVDAQENPYTYSQAARDRDDPEKGGIMTRERFAIAWKGQLGRFIGRVYDVSRGDKDRFFWPDTHPQLWDDHALKLTLPSDAHPR